MGGKLLTKKGAESGKGAESRGRGLVLSHNNLGHSSDEGDAPLPPSNGEMRRLTTRGNERAKLTKRLRILQWPCVYWRIFIEHFG